MDTVVVENLSGLRPAIPTQCFSGRGVGLIDIYNKNDMVTLKTVAEMTLTGTAKNKSFGNIALRSSSEVQEPRIREPPEENGEIAELCAPITIQEKRTSGLIPVVAASVGTSGYRAGHTTPSVLEKKLMIAPTKLKAIGINHVGRLLPAHEARRLIVPASIATLISIPTPQIMRMVFQGTFAMTSFCGASFINSAMAEKIIATRPTSILPFM